jgi:outer membrane protein OmpA-like peptidoglycan-associated protein
MIPNTILFDFDSYALRYEARLDLDRVTDILLRYPETRLLSPTYGQYWRR